MKKLNITSGTYFCMLFIVLFNVIGCFDQYHDSSHKPVQVF